MHSAESAAVRGSPGLVRRLARQLFVDTAHQPDLDRSRLAVAQSVAEALAELLMASEVAPADQGGLLRTGAELLALAYLQHGMAAEGDPLDLETRLQIIVQGIARKPGGA